MDLLIPFIFVMAYHNNQVIQHLNVPSMLTKDTVYWLTLYISLVVFKEHNSFQSYFLFYLYCISLNKIIM